MMVRLSNIPLAFFSTCKAEHLHDTFCMQDERIALRGSLMSLLCQLFNNHSIATVVIFNFSE